MTDLELARFLGIADDARWPRVIAKLEPKRRAFYERLSEVATELRSYEEGVGPKPKGVIICGPRHWQQQS